VNNIDDFTELDRHLKDYRALFDLIIIVNTGCISIAELMQPQKRIYAFDRANRQRDFGSYQFAIKKVDVESCKILCLINDSVLWDIGALKKFVQNAQNMKEQVIGMTISNQRKLHLQSFCILFKNPNIKHLRSIIEFPNVFLKRSIVLLGEIKLSQELGKLKVSFEGVWSSEALLEKFHPGNKYENELFWKLAHYLQKGIHVNPSIHLAIPLLKQAGVMKKVILNSNPAKFRKELIEGFQEAKNEIC
jgi:hypothetical protein